EPISMLDVSIRIGILNLILKLKREFDIAFLYITHDIASARYVADEVLVMYRGKIVEHGPTDAVLLDPRHAYTQMLLSAVPQPETGLRLEAPERAQLPDGDRPGLGDIRPRPLVRRPRGPFVRRPVARPPAASSGARPPPPTRSRGRWRRRDAARACGTASAPSLARSGTATTVSSPATSSTATARTSG